MRENISSRETSYSIPFPLSTELKRERERERSYTALAMRTSISMLRLIRSASASSSSQSQLLLLRRGYFSESVPEQKGSVLGAAGAVGQTLAGYINTRSEAVANMTSNPISPTVPIAAEIFKKAGTYGERKPFGVTSLDVIRAKTFYGGKAKVPAEVVNVPVFGGHAGITTLPLFSQAGPKANLAEEDFKALTKHSQDEGTEVGDVKTGKGPATFSMVFASALFADACLKGLNGAPGVVEGSFEHCSIIELPKMLIYLWPLPLFWHINNGIEEIIKDYVHHEITRTWILVSFRLFLLIAVKDVFLSFAFPG